jgi:hypothetical protein
MSNITEIRAAVLEALREGKLIDTDEGTHAIGAGRDVEDYDMRAIVEELAEMITQTPDVTRVGELAYGVVWQVIDRHYLGGQTTTQLHGFGSYTSSATVEDSVLGYLNEFVADFNVDGLAKAYRDAVNAELAGTGIRLHGDDFYSIYPAVDDSREVIEAVIGSVDLGELAARLDVHDLRGPQRTSTTC